ncbi:MAG: phosphatase PAP2 family protein [Gammaproteobacteria bacterium]|nr:MAG: phosphatase PAP2 family protein [Gammaproteobacteria bacterium]
MILDIVRNKFPLVTLIMLTVFLASNVSAVDRTEEIGDDLLKLVVASSFASSVVFENSTEGSIQMLKSFVASQIIVESFKRGINKTRPNGWCCESAASGHASSSFVSAAFIHKRYGWQYAIPSYIASTYVSYSRVSADKHYTEDVVLGATIGILSAFYFTENYNSLKITPIISRQSVGFQFSTTW